MKLSFGQIRQQINDLTPGLYPTEIYDDHLIAEGEKGKYYRISYSVLDGKVVMGDKVEVQVEYVPVTVQAAAAVGSPVGEKTDADYGYKWRVQVIKYGIGRDGRINWPREPLVAALPLFHNSRVFAVSESQHQDPKNAPKFGKPVKDLVGWLSNPVDTGTAIEADFDVLTSAQKLRSDLLDSFERGNPNFLGLSVDIDALTTSKMVAGKKVQEPVRIVAVETDVVYDPTNEGKFLSLVAAAEQAGQKEDDMLKRLLAALKGQRPELAGEIDALLAKGDAATDAEIQEMLTAAMPQQPVDIAQLVAALKPDASGVDEAKGILQQAQLLASATTMNSELGASGLPDASQARIKKMFAGQVVDAETLSAAIKAEKEYLDTLLGSGSATGVGTLRTEVQGEPERLQAAMDKTFGVQTDDKFKDVPMFDSIRAAYVRMTGDTNVSGVIPRERLTAAFDSTTFSYVLGNTLYRRMVQDYKEASDFGLSRIVSSKRNAKDFRTIESVRIGYFGDIPDVNPEAADYADLGTLTDEEVSYALNQKGGLVIVTRKMIINDDLSTVQKIISRLPRAARRTRAKRAWAKFISNATYKGDSKAVFHVDHGNLVTDAFSLTSMQAAKTAMAKQTELGSGERLQLRPVTLAIPTDLWGTATQLNRTQGTPGAATFGNQFYQFFGADDSGIFENPFMTDATDWLLFADPREVEILEIAFLNGQEEPEMFVADNPTVGQTFVADKITYKIRMEDEVEILDYRGCYKGVVAG